MKSDESWLCAGSLFFCSFFFLPSFTGFSLILVCFYILAGLFILVGLLILVCFYILDGFAHFGSAISLILVFSVHFGKPK